MDVDKQTLISKLNEDLASELGAIIPIPDLHGQSHRPLSSSARSVLSGGGARRTGARALPREQDRGPGWDPTTEPHPVPAERSNREMLERVLDAERHATAAYTERAGEADAFGDKGLAVQLEDMVRDESGHAEETERILRDWVGT